MFERRTRTERFEGISSVGVPYPRKQKIAKGPGELEMRSKAIVRTVLKTEGRNCEAIGCSREENCEEP